MQSIETSDFEIYTNLNQQTVEDKSRLNEIMIYHHLFISYQFINTWLMYYKSSYTSIGPERTLYQTRFPLVAAGTRRTSPWNYRCDVHLFLLADWAVITFGWLTPKSTVPTSMNIPSLLLLVYDSTIFVGNRASRSVSSYNCVSFLRVR